jgi:hypothetical protein
MSTTTKSAPDAGVAPLVRESGVANARRWLLQPPLNGFVFTFCAGRHSGRADSLCDRHWAALEPVPADPGPRLTRQNWLGQHAALNGFRALFGHELAELGRAETLRRYLPGLLPGISAAGFHALIRTGYGVRFGDDGEVCDGLAYWATAFSPLGRLGAGGDADDPRALYEEVSTHSHLCNAQLPGNLIFEKQKAASELPGFDEVVNALRPGEETLGRIAALSVQLYIAAGDLNTLHTVTGAHAYRMLQPFIGPREDGLRYFWRALVATYISAGAPPLVELRAVSVPAWAESAKRARESLDDHDIKLVDIAREEESFYGDTSYGVAAARRVHLV